jgi:hypothetical protein
MHIRRTANKGYITQHDLADQKGNPPTDGQRSSKEYAHANLEELLAHVQQHMGPQQPEPEQPGEQEPEPGEAD